jgi:hypothetical protein
MTTSLIDTKPGDVLHIYTLGHTDGFLSGTCNVVRFTPSRAHIIVAFGNGHERRYRTEDGKRVGGSAYDRETLVTLDDPRVLIIMEQKAVQAALAPVRAAVQKLLATPRQFSSASRECAINELTDLQGVITTALAALEGKP